VVGYRMGDCLWTGTFSVHNQLPQGQLSLLSLWG